MENALNLDTVVLAENKKAIVLLDQTLLPNETKYITLDKAEDIWEAIYALRVRGAPAIGVTGGYAYYILADQLQIDDMEEFVKECTKIMEYINSSRPTAVNLSWALNRMHSVLLAEKDKRTVAEMKVRLMEEADAIREEDIQISRNIGAYGFELLERGWDPKDMHVYCDETRPLLQGARLSAYEMQAAGIDTYVQCDNMASYTMKSGKIGIIFVGCDRVAANGDFANKIGTSGVAIIAKYYGIPFYVCAPSSTIDMTLESGDEIRIEQRKAEEVTEMWYKERMAPEGVGVVNPAFDVTDHELVTGIITEKGIAYAPFKESFEKMGILPVEKFVDKK